MAIRHRVVKILRRAMPMLWQYYTRVQTKTIAAFHIKRFISHLSVAAVIISLHDYTPSALNEIDYSEAAPSRRCVGMTTASDQPDLVLLSAPYNRPPYLICSAFVPQMLSQLHYHSVIQ